MRARIPAGAFVGLLALYIGAIFVCAGITRPLWLDEAHSVYAATHGVSGIVPYMRFDAHPPLYHFLLLGWMSLFGEGELAVRSLSVLFFLLSIGAMYRLGEELNGTGRVCAILFMLSPVVLAHVQNARPYTLLSFLGIVSTHLFYRAYLQGRRGEWSYAALCLLGLFTHYWFLFVMCGHGAVLLFRRERLGAYLATSAGASLLFLLLWFPTLRIQLSENVSSYLAPVSWDTAFRALFGLYGGAKGGVLFGVVFAIWCFRSRKNPDLGALWVPLILLLGSLFTPIALSLVRPVFHEKCTIIFVCPLALLLAGMLKQAKWEREALLAVMLLFGGYRVLQIGAEPTEYNDLKAVRAIVSRAPGGAVILATSMSYSPVWYYLRQLGRESRYQLRVFPGELAEHPGWRDLGQMTLRMPEFEREADAVIPALAGKEVFLLYGYDLAVANPLRAALDSRCTLREVIPIAGSSHKEIRRYQSCDSGEKK